MRRWTFQLSVGLIFALPLALLTFALAQAKPLREAEAPPAPECQDCHAQFQAVWASGAHAKALSDPVFKSAWDAQGNPRDCLTCHTTGYDPATGMYQAEGVTCEACHDPVSSNHPLSPASMSRSASLCGNCHQDTYFEWQASKHGQSDLTCVSCHDPHANSLRAADASSLCASCHGTRVRAFAHSNHSTQGLTCTDCHIGDANGEDVVMGKGQHSHTFEVNLGKCTKCHEHEIHNPAAAMLIAGGTPTPVPPDSMSSGHPATVDTEPKPVSPVGFAVFTGLIGLAFGIILAPWLERGFHRLRKVEERREVRP
ncbi:MAG TPA: cytochrome c3 family protein [Anaerolineales bacterium]|nr:cytochrome c3 family protein [Anaerolineales bacterium]